MAVEVSFLDLWPHFLPKLYLAGDAFVEENFLTGESCIFLGFNFYLGYFDFSADLESIFFENLTSLE
jgi:hypothetical protein